MKKIATRAPFLLVTKDASMDQKDTSSDAPPLTLPKPRKISAEIKRMTFHRSTSSSKSFSSGEDAPIIKKSSELMKETLNAPRSGRSLSFDTQTPYFCRQSRQLTLELEETLDQCEQELNETLIARKTSRTEPSAGLPVTEEVREDQPETRKIIDIKKIESSPDILAMKNEIAIERSKIGSERQKLSDTIDEIENMDFELNAIVKPLHEEDPFVVACYSSHKPIEKNENTFTEVKSEVECVEGTSEEIREEALPAITSTDVKACDENFLQPEAQSSIDCDEPKEETVNESCGIDVGAQNDVKPVGPLHMESTSEILSEIITTEITTTMEDDSMCVVNNPDVNTEFELIDSPTNDETTKEMAVGAHKPPDEILQKPSDENHQELAISAKGDSIPMSELDGNNVNTSVTTSTTEPSKSPDICTPLTKNSNVVSSSDETGERLSTLTKNSDIASEEHTDPSIQIIETDTTSSTMLANDKISLNKREDSHIQLDEKLSGDIEVSNNENVSLDKRSNIASDAQAPHSDENIRTRVESGEQITDSTESVVLNETSSNGRRL